MRKISDVIGKRFGRLQPFKRDGTSKTGAATFWCNCDCGNVVSVKGHYLTSGNVKSCGCLKAEHYANPLRKPPGEAARRGVLASYRKTARARGYEFSLSEDEAFRLFSSNCHYCGTPPSAIKRLNRTNGSFTYNGIDRVDNSRGYVSDNVVACCNFCNRAKNAATEEEFLAWAARLHKHQTVQ